MHACSLHVGAKPSCLVAHRDDKGEVDADGETGYGQHVGRSQLDKLYGLDEALRLAVGPTDRDHHVVNGEAEAHHHATIVCRKVHPGSSSLRS